MIGHLLTNPSDGKGDNYMVEVDRDATGKIVKFRIVAIDNDESFAYPIIRAGKKHVPGKRMLHIFSRCNARTSAC